MSRVKAFREGAILVAWPGLKGVCLCEKRRRKGARARGICRRQAFHFLGGGSTTEARSEGTKLFSTIVLLLSPIKKTMLCAIGTLAQPIDRRMPSESIRLGWVYRYKTSSRCELLDIGVQRVRMPPGLFATLEAQCHANSQSFC